MTDLDAFQARVIDPALSFLPPSMDSAKARVMLLAIGLQESRLTHQRQIGGPAVGLWQFERGGGVRGVLTHPASRDHAARVCRELGVEPNERAVYEALAGTDDVLDAAFARLLLWTDPRPLPALTNPKGAWECYLRTWRPGKPHPETWAKLHAQAVDSVTRYLSRGAA